MTITQGMNSDNVLRSISTPWNVDEEEFETDDNLEVTEEVTIEREYDENGNLLKEIRRVRRPKQVSQRSSAPINPQPAPVTHGGRKSQPWPSQPYINDIPPYIGDVPPFNPYAVPHQWYSHSTLPQPSYDQHLFNGDPNYPYAHINHLIHHVNN